MADYYPLIARAVAGLQNNTGESRRALYERARTALIGQLRTIDPPLSESEITRERLALEEVIRKVESEVAHRGRRAASGAPAAVAAPAVADPAVRARPGEPPRPPASAAPASRTPASAPPRTRGDDAAPASPSPGPKPAPSARERAGLPPPRPGAERPSLAEQSKRGFRDVVTQADTLGRAAAQANRTARRTYSDAPSPQPELDRLEPTLDTHGSEPAYDVPYSYDESPDDAEKYQPPPRHRPAQRVGDAHARSRILRPGVLKIGGALVLAILLAVGAVFAWPMVSKLMKSSTKPVAVETPKDSNPDSRPKIADRVGQPASSQQVAPVAQRVVLYDEEPGEPQGKQYVGSVIWRTEPVTTPPGLPQDYAVRADIEIPDRKLKLVFTIRRNTDSSLPASHTAELAFTLGPDFANGSIANIPGILMKQNEQTRGTPLAGLAVKVTDGFFLIGLSNVDADKQRNIALLKERPWFDVPVVYTNQRRAILAIEKGTPGDRAFADAFAIWRQ